MLGISRSPKCPLDGWLSYRGAPTRLSSCFPAGNPKVSASCIMGEAPRLKILARSHAQHQFVDVTNYGPTHRVQAERWQGSSPPHHFGSPSWQVFHVMGEPMCQLYEKQQGFLWWKTLLFPFLSFP